MSRPGIPISPIEIRLTKDRLSLVSRVLSSNTDAYKHQKVILDLVNLLGFQGDTVAQVKTLAMLADTALQAEDWNRAYETSEQMVNLVLEMRSSSSATSVGGLDDPNVQTASEVCWVACFQLGRQPEFPDVQKKLTLLGRALELCPPDKLVDILTAWRRLEQEDLETRQTRHTARKASGGKGGPYTSHSKQRSSSTAAVASSNIAARSGIPMSLTERLKQLHMPDLHGITSSPLVGGPDAAALANKAFNLAANFPFSVGARGRSFISEERGRSSTGSSEGSRTRIDSAEVSAQASRVLQKGLGWLLGDDD